MTEADKIIRAVCNASGLSCTHLIADRRAPDQVRARQVAYHLLHTRTGLSLPAIGRLMGGRDHTTVIWGLRRWQTVSSKPEAQALLRAVVRQLPIRIDVPINMRIADAAKRTAHLSPGTRFVLATMHELGRGCTQAQITERLGCNRATTRKHVHRLVRAGWVEVKQVGTGKSGRGAKQLLTALYDTDGNAVTPAHEARPSEPAKPAVIDPQPKKPARPKRPCNRCGDSFQPTEARWFRCKRCDDKINGSNEYNPAPGMEMIP